MSLLVIMGSGETAPTMVRTHRRVFDETYAGAPAAPDDAVMLDTPFSFQMNVEELTAKTQTYFAESVGRPVAVARWRSADAPVLERESALALLARARWAFAGPGSPTYALRQWIGTPVPDALVDVARRGGTVLLGSAAAVTAGTHAIPVYEIYKVGEPAHWVPGLDLLGTLTGISAVVVPHYNNAEGGGHDTRYCYLGEQRLRVLEAELPAATGILGVDEHTALLLDLAGRTATVAGNGVVTIRRDGGSRVLERGSVLSVDELAELLAGGGSSGTAVAVVPAPRSAAPAAADTLRRAADEHRNSFDAALAARDTDACVTAVLSLEETIVAWSRDSLQSDDTAYARRVLRALVVRLGEVAAVGGRDPRAVVAPYVELLVELRAKARDSRDFAAADVIRDRLAAIGVELRDTGHGVEWELSAGNRHGGGTA